MLMMATVLMSFVPEYGGGRIHFAIKPTRPLDVAGKPQKSPTESPEVYLDGHTLYFDEAIEGCPVLLIDEDENVVFSDSIGENQIALTFPSTLTGTFELQIIQGNIIFYCEIEL